MRLFLSDTFFERYTELPRNVQQKVIAFQKKFRENSTSAAIHLEPILQFKDSSLRTARLSDGYRAVIGVLDGEKYMLLYVDQHDDAYRWAQNKKFVWNEHTQSCQIIPVVEKPIQAEIIPQSTPDEQSVLQNIEDAKLLKIGVPEELLAKVKSINDIDDLEKNMDILPEDVFENLFNLLDDGNIDDIIENIEAGFAKEGEDALLSGNNQRQFVEITDDEYLAKVMEEGMEKWQIFLHPSQRRLVEADYKGTTKVSGSAGTGKTIAAIHRLKHLCAKSTGDILFTTYTTTLKKNIAGLIDKLSVPRHRYTLDNIDQVLNQIVRKYNIDNRKVLDYGGDNRSLELWREVLESELSEFDEEFLYNEYIDVIVYNNNQDAKSYMLQQRTGRSKALTRKQRLEIWHLVEKYVALKQERNAVDRLELFNIAATWLKENKVYPYMHVIADEFQDFSNPELRFLRALAPEGRNDLFLTGDPFQRIYSGRRLNFGAAGINVRGKRSQKLKVNYRTTEEIKKIAVAVIKGQKYDDLDGGEENNKGYVSLVHGSKPIYAIASDANEEVLKVLQFIDECMHAKTPILPKDICVAARSKRLYKEVQDEMHRRGIAYQNILHGDIQGDKNGISFCTFHSLKGLEYRVIILVGVNESNLPSVATAAYPFNTMDAVEKKEYLTGIKSLLYVAITRARQLVFVTGYGKPTGLLEHE